jgi:M6 family metalloprotease-like protein
VFSAALSFACRRAVLWLAIILALALSAALPERASAATSPVCSPQEQATRVIALRIYWGQMKAERAAFFRLHKSPRARQAFVDGQRKKRNSLRAAIRACKVSRSNGAPEGAADPAPASCSPTLFSAPYTEMNEGTTNSVLPLRPDGQIRAVMLFVDFPGLHASESMSALYDRMVPAARKWFTEVSYDRVRLDVAPIWRWHRMPQQIGAYHLADGISWREHEEYISDAVKAADSQVDFSHYDVVYVVAPKGSGVERSPAFQAYAGSGIEADGNELRWGATFFEDTRSSAEYAGNVLIHETGHIIGLPDLYDVPNPDPTYWPLFRFAGGWDMMSWNDPGTHFLAWNKWKLGWLDSSQLTCLDGPGELTTTITPLARQGGLKAVVLPMGPSSAYVVEARRKIGEDSGLCDTGVLVYSVDSTIRSGYGPVRVRAAQRDTSSTLVNQCGPLYNAPFDKADGEVATFEDANAGFSVRVLSSGTSGYRVQVTRSSLSPQAMPAGSFSPGAGEGVVSEGSLAPPLQLLPASFAFGIGWDLSGQEDEH